MGIAVLRQLHWLPARWSFREVGFFSRFHIPPAEGVRVAGNGFQMVGTTNSVAFLSGLHERDYTEFIAEKIVVKIGPMLICVCAFVARMALLTSGSRSSY